MVLPYLGVGLCRGSGVTEKQEQVHQSENNNKKWKRKLESEKISLVNSKCERQQQVLCIGGRGRGTREGFHDAT